MQCEFQRVSNQRVVCRWCGKRVKYHESKPLSRLRSRCLVYGMGDVAKFLLASIGIVMDKESNCRCEKRRAWLNRKTPRWLSWGMTQLIYAVNKRRGQL